MSFSRPRPGNPLSNQDLVTTIQGSTAAGDSWSATWQLLQGTGYRSQRQVATQLKSAGWSDQQIQHTFGYKPSFLDTVTATLSQGVLPVPISAGAAGAGAAEAGAGEAAAGGAAAGGVGAGALKTGLLIGAAGAIGGVEDFLKLIAWLFHPVNLLRAVEFITGLILMILGLRSSFRSMRGLPSPVPSSAFRRLPFLRVRRARREGRLQAERAESRKRTREKINTS